MYTRNSDKEYGSAGEGAVRKVLSYSPDLMACELLFEPGAVGAMHSHPHQQIGYIISGSLVYHEEGQPDVTLGEGDTYIVAPNVMHGINCLTSVKLLDIFTPMREDFI